MISSSSVRYFDTQFQRQLRDADLELNPFEQVALPYLQGRVLDFGCGLGNLAVAAARRGCSVVALDASPTAIEHVRSVAREVALAIEAAEVDLREYAIGGQFDAVVSIGVLMFLDCPTALAKLADLKAHVRPGGVAVVNVLVEGTTFADMFDPSGHCLLSRDEIEAQFAGWEILHSDGRDFPAPGGTVKAFATLIARKPA
jgi:tellurite methyltransferase